MKPHEIKLKDQILRLLADRKANTYISYDELALQLDMGIKTVEKFCKDMEKKELISMDDHGVLLTEKGKFFIAEVGGYTATIGINI